MKSMLFALLIAFLAVLAMGPFVIPMLRKLSFGATERDYGLDSHKKKSGTPIMGGVMMMLALGIAAIIFAPAQTRWTVMLPAVLFTLGFSLVGLADDVIKAVLKRPEGLMPWQKIVMQLLLSAGVACFCYFSPYIGSAIYIPFTDIQWDLGWFYIPCAMFVMLAVTNSANLLDGVDGLLSSVETVIMLVLGLIALFMNQAGLDQAATGNVMVLCLATAGACMGFLRFNTYPARVFMGDSGSFALGGAYVMASLILRQPLLIVLMGIMMVLTALSDIIQISSIKIRHKKVFRMAPLHHHFELGGMPETRIVAMYTLVTAIACVIALLSLTI